MYQVVKGVELRGRSLDFEIDYNFFIVYSFQKAGK